MKPTSPTKVELHSPSPATVVKETPGTFAHANQRAGFSFFNKPMNTRKRTPKRSVSPMPNVHYVMACSTVGLLVLCLVLYMFAPTGKELLYASTITGLIGFLTGKFTNSFGKVPDLVPQVHATEKDDDHEEEGDTSHE